MPDKNKLLELPMGRYLSLATKLYFSALTKRLEDLDVERHYSILLFIYSSDKRITQQCIADLLKIDKASMVRIVDYLSKKKYIRRIQNPKDRREHLLELTSKALGVMPQIQNAVKVLNKKSVSGLSKKRTHELYESLSVVCSNLNKEPSARVIVNYKRSKVKSK